MTDPSPDLSRLRTLEYFLVRLLSEVREAIAKKERSEAEQRRGIAARPPQPDWLIEFGINRRAVPVAVHTGGCHMAGKRSKGVSAGEARRALADGVSACMHCRPDNELGMLD
ncbi:DUF6233 domain-containing protein [Streptomyces sp. NPDC048290]|uniref:DUF6233 domain-containing protein n=1 Tax=Streptomyces sp. NPDC048290 TaxID=3155811 RepID=UPI00343DB15A